MPAREACEGFPVLPPIQIDLEDALKQRGNLGEGQSFEDIFADGSLGSGAAAKDDIVAFDGLAIDGDLDALEANIAYIMLGARMRAAGEVDIEGLIDGH